MKKLLTILLVLISFSSFAQFEAGEYINSDTVKIDGVPLLLNAFKKDSLGGAGNIFYSTGASSQPASGSLTQLGIAPAVEGGYLPRSGGSMLNTNLVENLFANFSNSIYDTPFQPADLNTINKLGTFTARPVTLSGSFNMFPAINNANAVITLDLYDGSSDYLAQLGFNFTGDIYNRVGAAGSWQKIYHSGNSNISSINWNAKQYISHIPTGTPPLVVASSTKVDSLNVGLLDGKKASDFQLKSDTLTFDATLSDLADSSAAIRTLANTKAVVSGTDNYIMKKTGVNTLGNSFLFQDASFLKTNADFKFEKSAPAFYLKDSHSNYSGFIYVYDSIFGIQKRNYDTDAYISNPYAFSLAAPHNTISVNNLGFIAFGHNNPLAKIHPISTGTQLKLGYDANKYTDLSTGSTGNLTIDPTGDTVKVVGAVNSTGGFFKNGVEIIGGGGSMVYPINSGIVTYNGTTWGTSITNNSSLWNNAYDKKIISAAFSGTSTKTLTLYQQDGNVLQASFTDEGGSYTLPVASTSTLGGVKVDGTTVTINGSGVISTSGTSKWTADTYGINYQSGNVGIKRASDDNTGLIVGDGTQSDIAIAAKSYSGYAIDAATTNSEAIRAFSVNNNGVYAISTNNAAVFGVSTYGYGGDFTGLGCRATKFYVSSLNTAPTSSTATGTTGEIRFTADYIYVCVATNTWKRTAISTW